MMRPNDLKTMTPIAIVAAAAAMALFVSLAEAQVQGGGKVYELRTYTVPEDRLELLHKRFREHTLKMFEKHGMTNVVYLRPQDPEKAKTTLVYLIAHASREQAKVNWSAFGKDPEWQRIAKESGVGPVKVDSQFFDAADYSPMK